MYHMDQNPAWEAEKKRKITLSQNYGLQESPTGPYSRVSQNCLLTAHYSFFLREIVAHRT
jgi:hypothetical protein